MLIILTLIKSENPKKVLRILKDINNILKILETRNFQSV